MLLDRLELLEVIKNGENSFVEFERDEVTAEKLARELVAFANLEGGMVLLGVEDDESITGVNRQKIEEFVMATCRDKIRPALIPSFQIIDDLPTASGAEVNQTEAPANKSVAIVRVVRGFDVHTLWHNNKESHLIRVGSQTRDPSKEELARLFQRRGMMRAELNPVSGAKLSDLDFRRLGDYFAKVRGQWAPAESDIVGWQKLLSNTELVVDDGITVAALLLFGKNPKRFLPHSGIDAWAFYGDVKDYAAIERTSFIGPMLPLLTEKRELVEPGLIEQAIAFVRRNTKTKSFIEPDGARRIDKTAYPEDAIREALINALVHRDYTLSGTNIELGIYSDRIEVVSPGRLANGITVDRMLSGCRATRNEMIKDVMRDYRYLEHSGMGIPFKIVRLMKEHNGTEPTFILDHEQVKLQLWLEPKVV